MGGAAEFYERLWSADYAQCNEHYVSCFDGTFLIDEPIFDDFVPYEAPSYCEENNAEDEDEDYDESAAPGSSSAWPLLFALSLFLCDVRAARQLTDKSLSCDVCARVCHMRGGCICFAL